MSFPISLRTAPPLLFLPLLEWAARNTTINTTCHENIYFHPLCLMDGSDVAQEMKIQMDAKPKLRISAPANLSYRSYSSADFPRILSPYRALLTGLGLSPLGVDHCRQSVDNICGCNRPTPTEVECRIMRLELLCREENIQRGEDTGYGYIDVLQNQIVRHCELVSYLHRRHDGKRKIHGGRRFRKAVGKMWRKTDCELLSPALHGSGPGATVSVSISFAFIHWSNMCSYLILRRCRCVVVHPKCTKWSVFGKLNIFGCTCPKWDIRNPLRFQFHCINMPCLQRRTSSWGNEAHYVLLSTVELSFRLKNARVRVF